MSYMGDPNDEVVIDKASLLIKFWTYIELIWGVK